MRYVTFVLSIALLILTFSFREKNSFKTDKENKVGTNYSVEEKITEKDSVKNGATTNQALGFVTYAKTLIGTPYLYGSVNPTKGLDCSGFINVVSAHFGIKVPRSSVEFTKLGSAIETNHAKPGDLILFTGTDPNQHIVGHIGIITDNLNGQVQFIHSSSGKANGVTISDLEGYYQTRLVKVIRIFPTSADKVVG